MLVLLLLLLLLLMLMLLVVVVVVVVVAIMFSYFKSVRVSFYNVRFLKSFSLCSVFLEIYFYGI